MAQQLRAMAVLLGLVSVPSLYRDGCSQLSVAPVQRNQIPSLSLPGHQTCTICAGKISGHEKKKKAKISVMHLISQSNLLECSLFRFQFWGYQNGRSLVKERISEETQILSLWAVTIFTKQSWSLNYPVIFLIGSFYFNHKLIPYCSVQRQ